MIEITRNSAIELLEEIVAEYGKGHLYRAEVTEDRRKFSTSCYYVHNTPTDASGGSEYVRPGCIVGHFLHRLGVPLDDLERHEGSAVDFVLDHLQGEGILYSEDGVLNILREAQTSQDLGNYWGEALGSAKRCKAEWEDYNTTADATV